MSSASDLSAFEHSVEPATGEVLFSGKKWTYIQDSSSTSGQYSGQIQLNMSSISSQAVFVNWSEAVIQLPVKLQILNGSGSSITNVATIDQLVPKAGAWQFIDSVSVVIDGVTVQTNQIHENVNATFKALTEWSLQDAQKYGPTSTFTLDSYDPPITNCPQALDNLPTANFMSAVANLGEHGLANTYSNSGARERSLFTSVNTAGVTLAYDVAGSVANAQAVAKLLVYVAPADVVAAGAPFYVAHYIATIRLADICDFFKKTPMSKNAKGFIYLNYNSSLASITTGASAGVVSSSNIASIATNMRFGNTWPILYNVVRCDCEYYWLLNCYRIECPCKFYAYNHGRYRWYPYVWYELVALPVVLSSPCADLHAEPRC
ncbi:unnamed protein product [Phytophthora fragariaefolia]|uniref:Unnamed protein product n=1 Tax=Phytophthora fragariaefolia TaxID=1490495 RepID=A0A9W6XP24_9STRA|nr:unnamed protein product [Phytophthora fragariaefolia]